MLRILPSLLVIALWIWAFIDCVTTPEQEVRHLPKVVWVIVVLLFPLVGSAAWVVAGRRRRPRAATGPMVAPDDNPEFLASLDKLREREDPEKP
ncbi:PLD nuclease N-terminal domain-containing protein [Kitasatospora sp. NPDC002227]|uniref:PLD nuclease N-terminal domain-containing protein n=1 Tax=Kitasatospora sp. NPDC002227 TaxID=3154773 RepID=UPI0033332E16